MNLNFILFVLLGVLAVVMFMVGAYRFWRAHWGEGAALIKRRLSVMTDEIAIDTQSFVKSRLLSGIPALDSLFKKIALLVKLEIFLKQASVSTNVGRFLMWSSLMWLLAWVTLLFLDVGALLAAAGATAPVLGWVLFLQRKRGQRVAQIEAQLPETLDLMARAMQAGHAFSSALLIVGTEGTPPIRGEFQTTFDEINFGIPMEAALHNLTQRVASRDVRFFVVAVLIQLETGGNLTEVMKSLATLIRERQRIVGSVKVLTAEGRLSAWILSLLPFGIGTLLSVINPEFISKLWTEPMGIRMLQVSLGLMVMGIWWMRRMVNFRI